MISSMYQKASLPKNKQLKSKSKSKKRSKKKVKPTECLNFLCPVCMASLVKRIGAYGLFYSCDSTKCNYKLSQKKYIELSKIRQKATKSNAVAIKKSKDKQKNNYKESLKAKKERPDSFESRLKDAKGKHEKKKELNNAV